MSELGILPQPIPFGKYYLLERVNIGGMAEIFKAKAFGVDGFERLLAIKKILSAIAEDESFINMFIDEAKIAGQLNHPNIAQIFDLGKVGESYFIALEYISGKDLKTIFERSRRIGEKVTIPRVCYLMMKVCEGLGYAHHKKDAQGQDLNIVHRDVSPQNLLLSYEGEVKIIDFGIAKAQGKTSETQVGVLKGKFSYMSPEQVRGLHIDHRSDIFSLGIVLSEMLTLKRLFLGESDFDTLEKIRKVEMSPPSLYNPHIPKDLEDIVLKALAKSPEDRFQSAYEFADALEYFMRTQGYYYTNKDLASYMKESFSADIEFENKKVDYYRQLNLKAPLDQPSQSKYKSSGGARPGLSWGDDEKDTQLFDRYDDELDEVELSLADIVYSAKVDAPSAASEPAHVAQVQGESPTVEYNRAVVQASLDDFTFGDEPRVDRFGAEIKVEEGALHRHTTAEMDSLEVRRQPHTTITTPQVAHPKPPKSGRSMTTIVAVMLMVVIICLSLIYAFWPWPSGIAIQAHADGPKQIMVFVDDAMVYEGPPPYDYQLKPGMHKVVIKADGYEEFKATIDFQSRKTRSIPALVRVTKKARDEEKNTTMPLLWVTTTPKDAVVTIQGKVYKGPSPKKIESLMPGSYDAVVSQVGFAPKSTKFEIKEGVKEVKFESSLEPLKLAVKIMSEPSKSEFSIFDQEHNTRVLRGRTPQTVKTLMGDKTYKVVVERSGFDTFEYMLSPSDDVKQKIHAKLIKKEVAPASKTEPQTQPVKIQPKKTPPKKKLKKKKKPPKKKLKKKKSPKVTGTAKLTIASKPVARVFIAGKDTGRYTPLVNFKVPAKKLKVELVNKKFGLRKVYYITLKPGQAKRIVNRSK